MVSENTSIDAASDAVLGKLQKQKSEEEDRKLASKVFLFAVENWTHHELEILLKQDPSLAHAQEIDGKRMTALHLASSTDRTRIVEVLLRYGAPLEARDRDDDTALHLAAQFGCLHALRILLQAGANPNVENRKYENMKTPLEGAVSSGHTEAATVLLEEAAKKLGIPTDRLVELRSQGQVRGFRDGASWKFPEDAIDQLADDLGDSLAGGSGVLVSEGDVGSAISPSGSGRTEPSRQVPWASPGVAGR